MYGLIMAGGSGKRFWPMSRNSLPKQFLNFYGDRTLIQMAYDRLQPIIKPENLVIITNDSLVGLVHENLPELPEKNIIGEPFGKDTAPCIGIGALAALAKDPDAIQVVLPADHLIKNVDEFQRILTLGADVARSQNCLVTIGIEPTRPETGYGYIQFEDSEDSSVPEEFRGKGVSKVKTFAEKPNLATAERFLDSGDFSWNSGIFIWKASTILSEIEESIPDLYDSIIEVRDHIGKKTFDNALLTAYKEIKSISIDYGVMENASNVYVVHGKKLGWSDVGSWEEYYRLGRKDKSENVAVGNVAFHDAKNNLVIGDKKLVAAIGLDNMVIVNTDDVVLVCPRERAQDIKNMVDSMAKKDLKKFL